MAGEIGQGADEAAKQAAFQEWLGSEPMMSFTPGSFTGNGSFYFERSGDSVLDQDDFKYGALEYHASGGYNNGAWYDGNGPTGSLRLATQRFYLPALQGWIEGGAASDVVPQADADRWVAWLQGWPAASGSTDAIVKGLNAKLKSRPSDFPVAVLSGTKFFKYGGYSEEAAIFAEDGGEWAVPGHNNPHNANFLRSVGADPDALGAAIASRLAPLMRRSSSGPQTIIVQVDGREIGRAVMKESRKNPELQRAVADCVRRAS